MRMITELIENKLENLGYSKDSEICKYIRKIKDHELAILLNFFHEGNNSANEPNYNDIKSQECFREALKRWKED